MELPLKEKYLQDTLRETQNGREIRDKSSPLALEHGDVLPSIDANYLEKISANTNPESSNLEEAGLFCSTRGDAQPNNQVISSTSMTSYGVSSVEIEEICSPVTRPYNLISETAQMLETPMAIHQFAENGNIQSVKTHDGLFFSKLLDPRPNDDHQDPRELKLLHLFFNIKNGTPSTRKVALRQLTDDCLNFGPSLLFNVLLPILKHPGLDAHERHLMVKVLDRILFKLQDKVKPFTADLMQVLKPLLVEKDRFCRQEGREIITALARAVGPREVFTYIRNELDNPEEQGRRTTAHLLAVAVYSLGLSKTLPFLVAVCRAQSSAEARWIGCRAIQQLALIAGCGVLARLSVLVGALMEPLQDPVFTIRSAAAAAIAALAEASSPYGVESFTPVLDSLWIGVRKYKGRVFASYLQALGSLVPLMDPQTAKFYNKQVMEIAVKELGNPVEQVRRAVLSVIVHCCSSDTLDSAYVKSNVLTPFFDNLWLRRLALDKKEFWPVVHASVSLASRAGSGAVVTQIVERKTLTDSSAPFQAMGMEVLKRIVVKDSLIDLVETTERRLIDALITAQGETRVVNRVMTDTIKNVATTLGSRMRPYLPAFTDLLLRQITSPSAEIREQALCVVGVLAPTIKLCGENGLLVQLCAVLYEQLGEEYPDVLAAVISSLRAIIFCLGYNRAQPPVKDLLPRLTPILRNRNEKVQAACILLVGSIADKGSDQVHVREWMRICFELLDLLKAPRQSVRRAANDTFGMIAKGIGPQDVLLTLLTNLRVQDRQSRVCSAVAIGIVADVCGPFTTVPAMLNEYRAPDINVQHGVLKAFSFLCEYIGPQISDLLYSIVTMVDHALTSRNQVHRQTAATVVKHLALGCYGKNMEEVMIHFLNELMPSIFETSPHVIERVIEGIDALHLALGPGVVLGYIWAGLFHPARNVRQVYWNIYNFAYVRCSDAFVPFYPIGVPDANVWY